jgi:hypothetical protein
MLWNIDDRVYVPVIGLIRRVLDERPSHTAPAARFRNELEDYMLGYAAAETLKTIVSGRATLNAWAALVRR